MSDTELDYEKTVTEAKTGFNLMDRLQSRPTRVKEVVVYTDEVLGEKHAKLSEMLVKAKTAAREEAEAEVEALISSGDIDADGRASKLEELTNTKAGDYATLEEEVARVAREIHQTGFTFTMRAVPSVVLKMGERKVRKALDIKGNVPIDQLEEFSDALTSQALSDSVEKYVVHETGETITEMGPKDARALADFLPKGEYDKLDAALGNLSMTAHISKTVTDDADF